MRRSSREARPFGSAKFPIPMRGSELCSIIHAVFWVIPFPIPMRGSEIRHADVSPVSPWNVSDPHEG